MLQRVSAVNALETAGLGTEGKIQHQHIHSTLLSQIPTI